MDNLYITTLKELTISKEKLKIKQLLEKIPNSYEKGIVFEEYLRLLFEGNGWIAVRNGSTNDYGADVLLYHPKSPEKVTFIVQAKNHSDALDYDKTKIELIKFEDKGKSKYNCHQYMLISLNGFVKEAKKLERFNMNLEEWSYIEKLIDSYDENRKVQPEFELFAHNKIAYEISKEFFIQKNKVAIVQATGTGKSYIIIKYISEFWDKKFLILTPQKYIIDQIKDDAKWIIQNTLFMTYAKLKNLSDEEMLQLNIDFIVLDEFHRCGAEYWGDGVNRLLKSYSDAKILGTSATPIRYLDDNRDMTDELFDGNVAVNLSLSESIIREILPMPIYVSALYTLEDELNNLQKQIENNVISDAKVLLEQISDYKKDWEKSKGIPEILKKYVNGENMKFIVFCENKEHISEMLWLVEMWFTKAKLSKRVRKYTVMSGNKNNDIELDDFKANTNKDEVKLLFAVDMLNEGIHISGISGVILLRSTRSPRIFYQQIGRAIQAGNDNSQPLIFDFVNNFNNICTEDFIKELINASESENKLRAELGLRENCPNFTIYDETKDEIEFFKSIEAKLTNIWDYRYDELVKYKNTHGNTLVSKGDKDNSDLSKWVYSQRTAYRYRTLRQDKFDRLNEIGFAWDAKDAMWQKMYQELVLFYKENGHCRVKRTKNKRLAHWVVKQREYNKKGDKVRLNTRRKEALDKIKFEWGQDEVWQIWFNELLRYKDEYGNCDVLYSYVTPFGALGSWANTQRQLYFEGQLPQEQIKKLESIGFKWIMIEAKWNEMYEQLIEFKKINGHCDVSRIVHPEWKKLGYWVGHQRKFYKAEKLSSDRIKKLEEIGFNFQPILGQPKKNK